MASKMQIELRHAYQILESQEAAMIGGMLAAGLGAVAAAIGFGFSARAQAAHDPSGVWDRAGTAMKLLGIFILLAGLALMVQAAPRPAGPSHDTIQRAQRTSVR